MPSYPNPQHKKILPNLLLLFLTPLMVFGALEFSIRQFAPSKVRTYFDDQTEKAFGGTVPRKLPGDYRIFIYGGSSAYGFPVADRYSITAWMRKSFPHLLPGRPVKVINCAWPGKDSELIAQGAYSVLKYKPDLFIIYSGHNEALIDNRLYMDNRLYWLNLQLKYHSAFYRYLSIRLERLRKHILYGHSGHVEKFYREEVIAREVYKKPEVSGEVYGQILKNYVKNMETVIRIARQQKIDVIFLTPPSNLSAYPPEYPMHHVRLPESLLAEWTQHFENGKKLQGDQKFQDAVTAYKKAMLIDPTFAELQYRIGTCYLKTGSYKEAKNAFTLARDFDGHPTRAKSEMIRAVIALAQRHGMMLVDIVALFEKISPHGIIGSQLVYDNVHPTVQAQQIISDAVLKELARHGKPVPESDWQWQALEAARSGAESADWKIDGSLNAYRFVLRGLLLWERKHYGDAEGDLEKALEFMPNFIESYAFLGDTYYHLGKHEKAVKAFQMLQEKDPNLLNLLAQKYPDIQQSVSKTTKV